MWNLTKSAYICLDSRHPICVCAKHTLSTTHTLTIRLSFCLHSFPELSSLLLERWERDFPVLLMDRLLYNTNTTPMQPEKTIRWWVNSHYANRTLANSTLFFKLLLCDSVDIHFWDAFKQYWRSSRVCSLLPTCFLLFLHYESISISIFVLLLFFI